MTTLVLLVVVVLLVAIPAAVVAYNHLLAELPSPENIGLRATFKTARILDRNGRLLYEILDPQGGRRTVVHLSDVSPAMRDATVAVEDITFYVNPGFDVRAIARALWLNARGNQVISGGSTITQQLVKNTLLSPEVSMQRKIKEAVLAWEVSRRYSKDEILEMYLNEVYYGNMAYGVEAASQTYFGKPASRLALSEAALLAGMVQAPAEYDPFTDLPSAKERQAIVLDLMVKYGMITPQEADDAKMERLGLRRRAEAIAVPLKAPHFAMYIRDLAEKRFGRDQLYYGGLEIHTSLDLDMQKMAEQAVKEHLARIKRLNVNDAALVAMDPATGEILALVGSADFFDDSIGGQVNVAVSRRQPGSTLKPFVYLTAFGEGFTPASIVQDVASDFSGYKPQNHDKKFRGPVRVREALANSLNIPAVRMLQEVGIDDALATMHRMGITDLSDGQRYGLPLALGAGEVKLVDLTFAYAGLAFGGVQMGEIVPGSERKAGFRDLQPVTILKVADSEGRMLYEHRAAEGKQVADPQLSYLITSILADDTARSGTYGRHSFLELSRPAAAKTGTTDDFRDGWTVGYTPDLVTGVWVGNADNAPMLDVYGVSGAGYIWHNFMEKALAGRPPRDFARPPGIREETICAETGKAPAPTCRQTMKELFAGNVAALSGLGSGNQRAAITAPAPASKVSGMVEILGSASAGAETRYSLDYSPAEGAERWLPITPLRALSIQNNLLGRWDTSNLSGGAYLIRLTVVGREEIAQTATVIVTVPSSGTPAAIPTPSPTVTPHPPSPTAAPPTRPPPSPTATFSPLPATATAVPATVTPKPATKKTATPTATKQPTRTPTPTAKR